MPPVRRTLSRTASGIRSGRRTEALVGPRIESSEHITEHGPNRGSMPPASQVLPWTTRPGIRSHRRIGTLARPRIESSEHITNRDPMVPASQALPWIIRPGIRSRRRIGTLTCPGIEPSEHVTEHRPDRGSVALASRTLPRNPSRGIRSRR